MSIADVMAEQLRMPRGPLAPLAARRLNRRNRERIEYTIEALDVRAGQRVLDVGFGGGVSLELLAERVGDGCAAGVDPSPDVVKRSRRLLADKIREGRVRVAIGAAEGIPFPDGAFDRVLSCQTVYFWYNLRRGLAEVYRVLAPEGRVALTMMPKGAQEHHGFRRRGFNVLSHDELMLFLEESGFTKVHRWPRRVPDPRWTVVAHRP